MNFKLNLRQSFNFSEIDTNETIKNENESNKLKNLNLKNKSGTPRLSMRDNTERLSTVREIANHLSNSSQNLQVNLSQKSNNEKNKINILDSINTYIDSVIKKNNFTLN